MAESSIRYLPITSLYTISKPTHPGFMYSLWSSMHLTSSGDPDEKRANLQTFPIRPEETLGNEGMPGHTSTLLHRTLPCVLLNYIIRWDDTYANEWTYSPSPREQVYRDSARLKYQTKLDTLKSIEEPTPAQTEQIKNLEMFLEEIEMGGPGFLTSYHPQGDVNGINWGLAVPNIPVTLVSTNHIQKNRAFSIKLFRASKPDMQAGHEFSIEFGAGNCVYALTLGADGKSSEFVHYRPMSATLRASLIEEVNQIKDKGRLTVQDLAEIADFQHYIDQIKHDVKSQGPKAVYTEQQSKDLKDLNEAIFLIKSSKKGLGQDLQDQISELEKRIYFDKMKFSLQEVSGDLLNRPIEFSFIFLRAGFVIIQSEDTRHIYENKLLTGSDQKGIDPKYGDMLPGNSTLTVRSDGGVWWMTTGKPLFDPYGVATSNPFTVPFVFDLNEVEWTYDGDADSPGCGIIFSMIHGNKLNEYRIKMELVGNYGFENVANWGSYTPEVYYVEAHIPASNDVAKQVVWDSTLQLNRNLSRIVDMRIRDDESRSRLCEIHISDHRGSANLPVALSGLGCDAKLRDTTTHSLVNVINGGCVVSYPKGQHDSISTSGNGIDFEVAAGNIASFNVTGCEGFLDKEIDCRIIGNNQYVGDYLRKLARDAGLLPAQYANLPVGGADNCPKIKMMVPGSSPDVQPELGVRYWEWMRQIVKKHAPRWILWVDGEGLRLTPKDYRNSTSIEYSTDPSASISRRVRRFSTEAGGLKLSQETKEVRNKVMVIGALNPRTGMRYSAVEVIPQSYYPQFSSSMFYIGSEHFWTAPVDESLHSNAACLQAARTYLNISPLTPQGLAPWDLTWKCELDLSVRCGDLVLVNGIKFLVKSIDLAAINSGDKSGQHMVVTGQLAEDKRL